ncbi:MAG TPA: DUF4032 domain-containing protein [Anaerolineales bacterium]|nr:DUF4032 domain-containing protein [Anaerolineales bacterium]
MNSFFNPNSPDFEDLPWEYPIGEWASHSTRLEEVQRGPSRHPVVFVNYQGVLYAIKELPPGLAQKEYEILAQMESLHLPCVTPMGYMERDTPFGPASFLFTRYLEASLPYRSLLMRSSLERYRDSLFDAMAGLLVQLHLAGIYWGDCSLSNTLFRRDAGALQAWLVDAETAEFHTARLSPVLRHHDLEVMVDNIDGDLIDLETLGYLPPNFPVFETGSSILERYRRLWEEITREQVIHPDERYRIQERIRALNDLGFSVRDVEIQDSYQGEMLKLRFFITDRNFHRDQLLGLTGISAGEKQARQMMNEINEIKAYLSQQNNRSVPLSAAAYHWLERTYQPVISRLLDAIQPQKSMANPDPSELYCQMLEHKWFLSERAQRDVGHQAATEDYLHQYHQNNQATY